MVNLDIEALAGETVEAMDDVIDLDAASTAELRVLATDYGVSPDGDRERLIQRILQASRAQAEGGPTPEPEPAGPPDWELAGELHPQLARYQIRDVGPKTKRNRPARRNETRRAAW